MRCSNLTCLLVVAAAFLRIDAALAQPKADCSYFLEHKFSGKYVGTAATEDGAFVNLWGPIPEGGKDGYTFKLVASGKEGFYYLIHKLSGKYLCTGNKKNGARIHLWGPVPNGEEDRYKFGLVDAGEGSYNLSHKYKFGLVDAGERYYNLLHKYSGKFVCTGDQTNGGIVHTYGPIPQKDEDRYKFRFVPAD